MNRMECLRRGIGLLAAMLLAVLVSGCASVDPVSGRRVYNVYSLQDDIQLGQATLASNTKQLREQGVKVNADRSRVVQLETMMKRIAAVSDLPHLPYSVTLYHTNIVNAAAAPGGSMMVFEGLYDSEKGLVKDEDELAAVMAHEIAHVNARHSTERLSKMMTAALLTEATAQVLAHNDEEGWANGLRMAFAGGTVLWIPVYSRKDEYEADRVGVHYMARAGYDPRAMVRIWKRASEEKGAKDKASIFSTHPSSTQRWQALEQELPLALQEYQVAVQGGTISNVGPLSVTEPRAASPPPAGASSLQPSRSHYQRLQ